MAEKPTFYSSMSEHWHIARTLRGLKIELDPNTCSGVWQCYEVCPIGCWMPNLEARVVILHDIDRCIACGACVLQCPEGAIALR